MRTLSLLTVLSGACTRHRHAWSNVPRYECHWDSGNHYCVFVVTRTSLYRPIYHIDSTYRLEDICCGKAEGNMLEEKDCSLKIFKIPRVEVMHRLRCPIIVRLAYYERHGRSPSRCNLRCHENAGSKAEMRIDEVWQRKRSSTPLHEIDMAICG